MASEFETPVFRTHMINHEVHQRGHHRVGVRFRPFHAGVWEHGGYSGHRHPDPRASGIGKSECVLSLIERGYSLVSDDITRIRSIEGRELVGMSADITRFHMEVRGIGVINISSIFGVGSVRSEKRLDFVLTLKDWDELENVDRIGLDREFYEILGIKIPHVIIPVKKGRDLGRLVEVAALDQKLKSMGQNSAVEFNQRLLQMMSERRIR